MFKEVPTKVDLVKLEKEILSFWQKNRVFKKSLELRKDAPRWVFYEGPPTANGLPHVGHVLTRVFKDLFPRYRTMKGYYVLRKGGWDTHGLPVELEVEKELGFTGKPAIEEYGVAEFNQRCRESVFRYVNEWYQTSERIGFWIDMDDPYVTLTNEYIESVWWILKRFWEMGLLYEDYKVVPYCPRCGTPLSSHELAQGYATAEDPSVYVEFPLRDEPGTYFLVWTTTPWTLPGNVALAVHPHVEYALVEQDGERLILAKELLDEALVGEYKVVKSLKAKDLVGKHYLPIYTFLPVDVDYCYVIAADFVTTEEGTGIVHVAPAFGEVDLEVGREYDLPILQTVDSQGRFIPQVNPWAGLFVKDADPSIIEDLERRGLIYRSGTYSHTYPFCWRCDTPLLYYAKSTWFIKTTERKEDLLANNQKINWYPAHIKDGRFGNWLESNVDWALGRDRYWGTPLPMWRCESCGHQLLVGSIVELEERAGLSRSGREELDLHRPFVDNILLSCSECEGKMRRVPEVIDAWFDSGSMPVGQWHYPFENEEIFREQFPADFICEAVDQTRGWFYSLHAISTLLFNEPSYKNVIVLGLVVDAEGRKMSKSLGNVVDPWDVLRAHGADAMRWYFYTAGPAGSERRFSVELVGEVVRKFLLTLWNTYAFFTIYANIDNYDPKTPALPVAQRPALDRWILSELNSLVEKVDKALDDFDVTGAARPIQEFVELLSNWYVRRSRRRFWRSEQDEDKRAAYATLYDCLTTLSKLLAPFTPFLAEEIYCNLVSSVDEEARESVHLSDFPQPDRCLIDGKLMADTALLMRLVSLGHAARNRAGLKVRQPLAQLLIKVRTSEEREVIEGLADQVLEELNVKSLAFVEESDLVEYKVEPDPRLLGPKYGALYPKIKGALTSLDTYSLVEKVRSGEKVEVTIEGQRVALLPEEVKIEPLPRGGLAVAEEGGYLVGVTTTLTEELRREGLAREVVRRIQTLRKEADFKIEDTIVTYFEAHPILVEVMEEHGEYIKRETLSTALVQGGAPPGHITKSYSIEGYNITLALKRN
jgi:isoleucyl-tRNA synthetase